MISKLPNKVKHPNGNYYDINTSHKIGLKALQLDKSDVSDLERTYGILTLIFGPEAPKDEFMLQKAIEYLQLGESRETQMGKKEDIDLVEDYRIISLSIESQFPHVDLFSQNIHFWKFCWYIEALRDTLLNDVRNIRNMDLSEEKDPKRRKQIIEAKKFYALNTKEIKQVSLKELMDQIERRDKDV